MNVKCPHCDKPVSFNEIVECEHCGGDFKIAARKYGYKFEKER